MPNNFRRLILTISFTIIFIGCLFASPLIANQIVCGPKDVLLSGLEEKYGEKVAETGIDEETIVTITVNLKAEWTILVVPKNQPNNFCVLATGRYWTQDDGSSKGIAEDGSVFTFIFEPDRTWRFVYMDKSTASIKQITTGYGWQRIIDFRKMKKIDLEV